MQPMLYRGFAALFAAIGTTAIAAPRLSANQFGLPTSDPVALACIRAMGARDLVLGAAIFGTAREPRALRRLLRLSALIGLADAAFVASVRGVRPQHVVHLAGFVALTLAAYSVDVPPSRE